MTQVPNKSDGWIDATEFALPSQTLDKSEVDAFLEYLFSEVARRPELLLLREAAAVARYLRAVEVLGLPLTVLNRRDKASVAYDRRSENEKDRAGRWCAGEMARIVWGFLFQCGEFKTSTREVAVRFLQRHADTYLANPYLEQTMTFIETHDLPPQAHTFFRAPALRSGHMSVDSGDITTADDLSDRIFAAYHALPRAGIKKRSPRIASALTASKVSTRAGKQWVWQDVNDREKAHARRFCRQLRKQGVSKQEVYSLLEQHQSWRADFWISSFRNAQWVKRGRQGRQ